MRALQQVKQLIIDRPPIEEQRAERGREQRESRERAEREREREREREKERERESCVRAT
jgi:hypothetical protein